MLGDSSPRTQIDPVGTFDRRRAIAATEAACPATNHCTAGPVADPLAAGHRHQRRSRTCSSRSSSPGVGAVHSVMKTACPAHSGLLMASTAARPTVSNLVL
jgi:hypothetical protein